MNKNMRTYARFFCLAIAVVLVLGVMPLTAFSEGRMVIRPYIETGYQYDANFFKSENDTKAVNTYYVKPGFEFGYVTDKSLIGVAYTCVRQSWVHEIPRHLSIKGYSNPKKWRSAHKIRGF